MQFRFPKGTAPPAPPDVPLPWDQKVIGFRTGIQARDGATLFVSPSDANRLILFGGWNSTGLDNSAGEITTNEVWKSDDDGATWQLLLAYDPTPPTSGAGARPYRVHTPANCAHGGYHYFAGGDYAVPGDEVWRTADGETWERMSAAGEFGVRTLAMMASLGGNLYLCGGQTNIGDPNSVLADVWESTDNGATWTELAAPPWAARSCGSRGLIPHNGELFLIGGFRYGGTLATDFFSDVWSFDGTTWTEVLAEGHGTWTNGGRGYQNCFSLGGRLWVFNGVCVTAGQTQNIMVSDDNGLTWSSFGDCAWGTYYSGSHADAMCIYGSNIVRTTGAAFDQEVWAVGRFAAPPTPPEVVSVAPTSGPVAGGTVVSIECDDSSKVESVRIGWFIYVNFTVIDATHVEVTMPDYTGTASPYLLGAGPAYVTLSGTGGDSGHTGANIYTFT
jgi:hypothetical protein